MGSGKSCELYGVWLYLYEKRVKTALFGSKKGKNKHFSYHLRGLWASCGVYGGVGVSWNNKLFRWLEHTEQEDRQIAERMATCALGGYVWCCDNHPLEEGHEMQDEDGCINGVPVWKWQRGHQEERFYRAAHSTRPACGARCRSGASCRARVVVRPDGTLARRCRMHGGLSTGPKTKKGRAAIVESNRRRASWDKLGRKSAAAPEPFEA